MTLDWHSPTIFPKWIDEARALGMAIDVSLRPDVGVVNDAIGSYGERGLYRVLETSLALGVCPELEALYCEAKVFVETMFDLELVESPYERSRLNIKVYAGDGAGQGLHLDSQPITVLLCLADGNPLQLVDGDETIDVSLGSGDLLVFCGRETPHRVPPGEPGDFRVTVPMNFYFHGDTARPDWLDAAIYDNKPAPSAGGSGA